MEALQQENMADGSSLMDALITALVDPVPFGPDGECEKDTEFQENLVRFVSFYARVDVITILYLCRLLHTFSVQCGGAFSDAQRHALRGFFSGAEPAGDEFGLSREEFGALKKAM